MNSRYPILFASLVVLSALGSSCKRDGTRNETPAGASASPARTDSSPPKAAPASGPAAKSPAPAGSPAAGATGTSGSTAPGATTGSGAAGSTTPGSPAGSPGTTAKAAPAPPAVATPSTPAQSPASPGEKKAPAPAAVPPASGGQASVAKAEAQKENVVLTTSRGRVVIDLFEKDAPAHCENFKRLVRAGYFNGVPFHRVCYGFVQSGDPSGTGTGGLEETVPAEIKRPHLKGSLVAARKEENNPHLDSHGSQFFIMKIVHPSFDRKYTVFGQVIEGMDVVDRIPEGDREQDYQVPPGVAEKIIRAELLGQP